MKRAVQWKRPEADKLGRTIRKSKCGRFVIHTKQTANLSGRNGCFTVPAYELRRPDGQRIGKPQDQLRDALDLAETTNNPSWEPDDE